MWVDRPVVRQSNEITEGIRWLSTQLCGSLSHFFTATSILHKSCGRANCSRAVLVVLVSSFRRYIQALFIGTIRYVYSWYGFLKRLEYVYNAAGQTDAPDVNTENYLPRKICCVRLANVVPGIIFSVITHRFFQSLSYYRP